MATMTVSLPEAMQAWVEAQAASGGYADAGDYVRALIRRDQRRTEKIAAMQALIDEAMASGLSERSFDEILADASARADAAGHCD